MFRGAQVYKLKLCSSNFIFCEEEFKLSDLYFYDFLKLSKTLFFCILASFYKGFCSVIEDYSGYNVENFFNVFFLRYLLELIVCKEGSLRGKVLLVSFFLGLN